MYTPGLELLLFCQTAHISVKLSTYDFSAAALQVWLFEILGEACNQKLKHNRRCHLVRVFPPWRCKIRSTLRWLKYSFWILLSPDFNLAQWVKTCKMGQFPTSSEGPHPRSTLWSCSRTGLTFVSTQGPMLELIFPTESVIHKLSELCNVIASELILSHNLHYCSKGPNVLWLWFLPLFLINSSHI